jgi:hypothetical protein
LWPTLYEPEEISPPFYDDIELYNVSMEGKMDNNLHKTLKLNAAILSIGLLLLLQIVGIAFGYGMLNQQVQFNRELINQYRLSQIDVGNQLSGLNSRLIRIEAKIETAFDKLNNLKNP